MQLAAPLPRARRHRCHRRAPIRSSTRQPTVFLVMAGIVAVEKGAPAALALGRLDLAGAWPARSATACNAWPVAPVPTSTLVLHLAACVTLQGGCAPETAIGLIEQERAALGDCTSVRSDQLETLLRDALPPPEGDGVDAVRPDLIGEAFLLNELCPASRRSRRWNAPWVVPARR